ncbi:hypothetical protein SNE510_75140 [Streptomyces sp. NE5-10]|nr:hypothetical protein SNE510_75140 [Streptomyces sp. NE5-10]
MAAVELVRELVGDGSAGAENGLHGSGLLEVDGAGVDGNSTPSGAAPPHDETVGHPGRRPDPADVVLSRAFEHLITGVLREGGGGGARCRSKRW